EAPGGVELDDQQLRTPGLSLFDASRDEIGAGRTDGALHFEHHDRCHLARLCEGLAATLPRTCDQAQHAHKQCQTIEPESDRPVHASLLGVQPMPDTCTPV